MTAVFSYGTLRDAEYQRALFDCELPTRAASLDGWRAVFTPSGYLTIVPAPGATVRGAVVQLTAAQRAVADAWEEVPLYAVHAVRARLADGTAVACVAYVCPATSDERAPDGALSRHDRATVLAAIRAFRATRA